VNTSILLITISGNDRPGIVHEIASVVHRHGGNWEQSQLIHLSGKFVGLLQVMVEEEKREALRLDLLKIADLELTIAEGSHEEEQKGNVFQVRLIGADHPGIVSEIFGAAAELGLNVESMTTHTEAAADSGVLLFKAESRLSAGPKIDSLHIAERFERLAPDLLVEVTVDDQV